MNYSDRFEKWVGMEWRFEGTYGNIPSDSGGETFYGLCRKYYPNLSVWKSLDKLPTVKQKKAYSPTAEETSEIKDVYFNGYWRKVKGDRYSDVNLSYQVADFAVNAGVITSIKKLQSVLGVKADGIVGNITLTAANCRKGALGEFIEARRKYYESVSKKGDNKIFLKGWLNRVNKCRS